MKNKMLMLLACTMLALAGGIGDALAKGGPQNPPCDAGQAGQHSDHCVDKAPDCDEDPTAEGCGGTDPEPSDCPPAAGPVSGGVQQVADGLREGGAPEELAGGVETVNCEVIVAIEGTITGGGGLPEAPAPPDGGGLPKRRPRLPQPPAASPPACASTATPRSTVT